MCIANVILDFVASTDRFNARRRCEELEERSVTQIPEAIYAQLFRDLVFNTMQYFQGQAICLYTTLYELEHPTLHLT